MKIVYLQTNGETSGPFTVEEVRADLNAGRIPGDTPAYVEGMNHWQPVVQLLASLSQSRALPEITATDASPGDPDVLAKLFLTGMLLVGVVCAFYYGVLFDTSFEGVSNWSLMNKKACGVVLGCSLALLAALLRILLAVLVVGEDIKQTTSALRGGKVNR